MINLVLGIVLSGWILLGATSNLTYEIDPVNRNNVVITKNKFTDGEYEGNYLIKKWEISCQDYTLRNIETSAYSKDDEFIASRREDSPVHKVQKGSYGYKAMQEYWCK